VNTPPRSASPDVRRHRALASSARSRLLEVLRAEPGLDAATLADRLGLHTNTVRAHLNVLEDAGLVEPGVEDRDRPGRPRLLYRAVEPDRDGAPPTEDPGYRFLAAVLASYLGASTKDAASEAEQAGRAWGGFAIDTPPPFTELTPDAALERLVLMLDELGFAPALDDADPAAPRLVLRRCPFLEVAREHQEVVCAVHLGLMRGALAELGVGVQAEDLIPWAEPEACVAHLRVGPS
jgi:predicted ArsR family transcriptional regulator